MESSNTIQKPFSIILFDLGNVLVRVDYGGFLRTLGFDHEMAARELYELLEEDSRAYEMGKVTAEEFLGVINAKLQRSYTFEEFRRAWVSILPSPVPGVSKLVERLVSEYRLMLLSNTNELHFRHSTESFPILRHFERCFLSYQVGALKPEPAIYQCVLKDVDVPPRQVLFIDDLEQNVQAGRNAGMVGVVFRGADSLQSELKRLGVIL